MSSWYCSGKSGRQKPHGNVQVWQRESLCKVSCTQLELSWVAIHLTYNANEDLIGFVERGNWEGSPFLLSSRVCSKLILGLGRYKAALTALVLGSRVLIPRGTCMLVSLYALIGDILRRGRSVVGVLPFVCKQDSNCVKTMTPITQNP